MADTYGAVDEEVPKSTVNEGPAEDEAECTGFLDEITQLKWRVMIFILLLSFGGYFAYDVAGSIGVGPSNTIQSYFAQHGKSYTSEMNQALYSVYSFPNTVAATFGGLLVDNFIGLRKSILLFITLVTIGSLIVWVGVATVNYPVILLGRFTFGLGNESLSVAQQAFVARFFRGRWGLALAYGIVISFSRVGSSLNFLLSPRIAESVNVPFAALVGTFACCLSLAATVILVMIDLYAEKVAYVPKQVIKKDNPGGSSFSKKDLEPLNAAFAMVCVICVTVYISCFNWVGIGAPFFERKYSASESKAAEWVSFFQFACSGFSPFSGAIVDRTGRPVYWMIFAASGFTLIHVLFAFAEPQPVAMCIFMGFVYSFLAGSLWPAVPLLLPPTSIGLAYGLMNSMQNTGLAIAPLAVGAILDSATDPIHRNANCTSYKEGGFNKSTIPEYEPGSLAGCWNSTKQPLPHIDGFRNAEIVFFCIAGLGIVAAVNLLRIDLATVGGGILSADRDERKRLLNIKLDQWKLEEEARKRGDDVAPEKKALLNAGESASPSARVSMATMDPDEDSKKDPSSSPQIKDGHLSG